MSETFKQWDQLADFQIGDEGQPSHFDNLLQLP